MQDTCPQKFSDTEIEIDSEASNEAPNNSESDSIAGEVRLVAS